MLICLQVAISNQGLGKRLWGIAEDCACVSVCWTGHFVARSGCSLTLIAMTSVPAVPAVAPVGLYTGSVCSTAGLADSCTYRHTFTHMQPETECLAFRFRWEALQEGQKQYSAVQKSEVIFCLFHFQSEWSLGFLFIFVKQFAGIIFKRMCTRATLFQLSAFCLCAPTAIITPKPQAVMAISSQQRLLSKESLTLCSPSLTFTQAPHFKCLMHLFLM